MNRAAAMAAACLVVLVCAGGAAPTSYPGGAPDVVRLPAPVPSKQQTSEIDRSTVIVHFRRGVDTSRIRETLRQHGAGLEERDGSSVLVETNGRPVRQLLSDLEENPLVADAEPNRIFTVAGAPNDPLYEHQRPYLETAGLPDAWATTKGTTGTTVAILDTGIDLDHPEFAGRILPGRDFVNNDADPTDDEGHGTMVAGVAAAAADNGIGIAGAAGGVSILPVKVLDRNGQGDTWQISEGIKWAVAQGADVLNFSFTGGGSDRFDDAVRDAVRRNVVIVAAAGNDGEAWPYLPRSYENVLTVAATDHAGTFAWFSNHGPLVELAAPGVDITTTARAPGAQDAYAVASGTSFSTPLVSGAAALVRSVHPDWTVDQVARRLERTARDAGPPGVDDSYGFGIVDAASALADRRRTALPSVTGAEEPNNVLARATTFTGSAGGTISPEGDVDWFATTLAAPGWVTVRLTGPAVDPEGRRPEELDPVLKVYDPAGDPLRTSDGGSIGDPEGVLVPVATSGRYLIRVENYVGSRSPGPYTIEVAPAAAPARFAPATEQTLGLDIEPAATAIADVTGDGRNDVLVTAYTPIPSPRYGRLYVFPQLDPQRLGSPTMYTLAGEAGPDGGLDVGTADLDADGDSDVAVATAAGIQVLRQAGGRLLAPEVVHAERAQQLDLADVDGDRRTDVAFTRAPFAHGVVLVRNTAAGWVPGEVTADAALDVELGDLTGDGRADVVRIGQGSAIAVHRQLAGGAFAAPVLYPAMGADWGAATALDVADVTGDGRADAVVALEYYGSEIGAIAVFAQAAEGVLARPSFVPGAEVGVEARDLNADGRADLVSGIGGARLGIFHGLGASQFDPQRIVEARNPATPATISTGDVTGDGRPDLVTARNHYGLVVARQVDSAFPVVDGLRASPLTTEPAAYATRVPTTVRPSVSFLPLRDYDTTTGQYEEPRLEHGVTGRRVEASLAENMETRTRTLTPAAPLEAATPYRFVVPAGNGLRPHVVHFVTEAASEPPPPPAPQPPPPADPPAPPPPPPADPPAPPPPPADPPAPPPPPPADPPAPPPPPPADPPAPPPPPPADPPAPPPPPPADPPAPPPPPADPPAPPPPPPADPPAPPPPPADPPAPPLPPPVTPPPDPEEPIRGTGAADRLVGTSGDDVFYAGSGADRIDGRGGNDVVYGGPGADRVYGGAGNDRLVGGGGRDQLFGGPGNDVLDARDRARDYVHGGPGRDRARVDRLRDRLRSIERALG